jgi:integrase
MKPRMLGAVLILIHASLLQGTLSSHARPRADLCGGAARRPLLSARHWFEDAIANAGISNFTWPDIRHTFASRLVMAGADLRTVGELMGHKKIQMAIRYCTLGAVAQIGRRWESSPRSTRESGGGRKRTSLLY